MLCFQCKHQPHELWKFIHHPHLQRGARLRCAGPGTGCFPHGLGLGQWSTRRRTRPPRLHSSHIGHLLICFAWGNPTHRGAPWITHSTSTCCPEAVPATGHMTEVSSVRFSCSSPPKFTFFDNTLSWSCHPTGARIHFL